MTHSNTRDNTNRLLMIFMTYLITVLVGAMVRVWLDPVAHVVLSLLISERLVLVSLTDPELVNFSCLKNDWHSYNNRHAKCCGGHCPLLSGTIGPIIAYSVALLQPWCVVALMVDGCLNSYQSADGTL